MKVFITGATGYIGFNVAKVFRNEGYQVYGLTRSDKNAITLKRNEIIPVLGSMQSPNSYMKVIEDSDIIIHAAADYNANISELDKSTVKELINGIKMTGEIKKFIYTSGTWVYGSTMDQIINEKNATNPISPVSWRPEIDEIVISNPFINGVVIRPGCVYGMKGGMTNDWFDSIEKLNEINIVGDGSNHWPMVHAIDLANAYLLAAQSNVGGEIFNIVEEKSSSINEIISGIRSLTNFNGNVNYIPLDKALGIMGEFAEALAIDQRFDISKVKNILNWSPKHTGFYNELEIYYNTWKARNT